MLRGSLVRINERAKLRHNIGTTGIALERMANSGYIRVLSHYEGWLTDVCYPENELDVVQGPVEL